MLEKSTFWVLDRDWIDALFHNPFEDKTKPLHLITLGFYQQSEFGVIHSLEVAKVDFSSTYSFDILLKQTYTVKV